MVHLWHHRRDAPLALAHRRQGQQTGSHPLGSQDGADDRPGDRGTYRWADPAPPRQRPARPTYRPPVGPFDGQAGRAGPRAPAHAACGVHHVRLRGGSPVARSADRRPPCRSENDHRLRPPPPELRQACGIRRGRVRCRRMISPPAERSPLTTVRGWLRGGVLPAARSGTRIRGHRLLSPQRNEGARVSTTHA